VETAVYFSFFCHSGLLGHLLVIHLTSIQTQPKSKPAPSEVKGSIKVKLSFLFTVGGENRLELKFNAV
jgi:hypothetical protein